MTEEKSEITWDDIYTNTQEKRFLEVTVVRLRSLLRSPAVSDIKSDLYIPLSEKLVAGRQLAIDSEGLRTANDDRTFTTMIKEEQYADIIKQYQVCPGKLLEVKSLIEGEIET